MEGKKKRFVEDESDDSVHPKRLTLDILKRILFSDIQVHKDLYRGAGPLV